MKKDSMCRSIEPVGQTGDRLANPPPEEPDAENRHVQDSEGPGWKGPSLLDTAVNDAKQLGDVSGRVALPLITVLIPTFNRASDLEKNLARLSGLIVARELQRKMSILVSDNHSTDGTAGVISRAIARYESVDIRCMRQIENIGLERNCIALLSVAESRYVMWLGDDDTLQDEYVVEVVRLLERTPSIACIVPSFLGVTVQNEYVSQRDVGCGTVYLKPGFGSVMRLFMKGHQLSGLVMLREGMLDAYLARPDLRNLYLFKFFVGFNCMRGDSVLLSVYPVTVTLGAVKNWSYGTDGLTGDALKNVVLLCGHDWINRFRLENKTMFGQMLGIHLSCRGTEKIRVILRALMSRYLSPLFRLYIPVFCVATVVKAGVVLWAESIRGRR